MVCEYMKSHRAIHLKGCISWHVNYISVFAHTENPGRVPSQPGRTVTRWAPLHEQTPHQALGYAFKLFRPGTVLMGAQ